MNELKRVYCCACGRQVVSFCRGRGTGSDLVAPYPVVAGIDDQVFCADCAEDLDENGMFPEERASLSQG